MSILQTIQVDSALCPNIEWAAAIFTAKAASRGGIVRRAIRDVEREVGREVFIKEVQRRRFHLIECGGQFIVLCNTGHAQLIC